MRRMQDHPGHANLRLCMSGMLGRRAPQGRRFLGVTRLDDSTHQRGHVGGRI